MFCRICIIKKLINCRFRARRAYLCTCCGSIFCIDYNTGMLKLLHHCIISLKNKT